MNNAINSTAESEYLALCCAVAREAGRVILRVAAGGFTTTQKSDHSPVTEADMAANSYIINALEHIAPHIPIVTEEEEATQAIASPRFFLVDPLDGTRSFVRGEAEYTVNIALIEQGKPVFGVIYCPPQEVLYYGKLGEGAFKQVGDAPATPIHTRTIPPEGATIFRSRTEPGEKAKAFLETLKVKELVSSSSSVKFCLVAEGSADCYPRFGRTMEWDTAAGHAILSAAGGRVETTNGKPLTYGKPGFENPGFIAFGT